jgi:hypothetical protein
MFEGPGEPPPPPPPTSRSLDGLLAVVVAAIIVMPFVAGRHPSGGQTVLVLAAFVALAAICMALVKYGAQRQQRVMPTGPRAWPAPDQRSAYRNGTRRRATAARDRSDVDDGYFVDRTG